jgi:hypothetical protein
MQHPVAYRLLPNGTYEVSSFWGLMMNPWAWLQYAHNMSGAVITGAFVMAAVGALYVLQNREVTLRQRHSLEERWQSRRGHRRQRRIRRTGSRRSRSRRSNLLSSLN